MSTTNEIARNVVVVGNDIVTSIPFLFNYKEDDDQVGIVVTVIDTLTLVETVFVEGVDYVIDGSAITLSVPLPTGFSLLIERDTETVQSLDYDEDVPFPAEVTEASMDRVYFALSELKEMFNRAAMLGKFADVLVRVLIPNPENGMYLAWDGTTGRLKNASTTIDPLLLSAVDMVFDNTNSTLISGNVEGALNELDVKAENLETNKLDDLVNIGTGAEVYKQRVGGDAEIRSILSSTPLLQVVENTNDISIDLETEGSGDGDAITLRRIISTGSWAYVTTSAKNNWSIAFGDGVFVAVSRDGTNRCMRSTDLGLTWDVITIPSQDWYDIAFGNGVFVAVSNSGTQQVARSTNLGLTWNLVTVTSDAYKQVIYNEQVSSFFILGSITVYVSNDGGNNFSVVPSGFAAAFIATGANLLLIFSTSNVESIDLVSGTYFLANPTGFTPTGCVYGNGLFVAVDGAGSLYYSETGRSFLRTQIGSPIANVAYGDGLFVASGSVGSPRSVYSLDGKKWTSLTINATSAWNNISFGSGVFILLSTSAADADFSARLVPTVSKKVGTSSRDGFNFQNPFAEFTVSLTNAGAPGVQSAPDQAASTAGANNLRTLNTTRGYKDGEITSLDPVSYIVTILKSGTYRVSAWALLGRSGTSNIHVQVTPSSKSFWSGDVIVNTTDGANNSLIRETITRVLQLDEGDDLRLNCFITSKNSPKVFGQVFTLTGNVADFAGLHVEYLGELDS